MKNILLDGREFVDKATTHTILKDKLELPEYYGRNLDALWDSLSTNFSEKVITIQDPILIEKNLGRYGKALLRLFDELNEANDAITIVYAYTFNEKETEF
ncbi:MULTISPECIES: barstar family protein [unclassified Jeotgalibaca]|uniref:barstar family protein n=1 Tax=unclassified Jeotgalibaca TaxID=2621505 RepID=UPI003FCF0AD6